MGGGLMQLVAYGAQDIYLTGNPQITFFKVVYRRHTNFSMETIQQTLNGSNIADGSSATVTISRNGDLISNVYVVSDNKTVTDGSKLFQDVELEIGGQKIDKHSGHWMETWAELTEPNHAALVALNTTQNGTLFQNMSGMGGVDANSTGAAGDGAKLFVPLQFWFCRNPGLALPLIALQYHEVKVILEHKMLDAIGNGTNQLWADYIYLDTDERRRFAQVSHEYLIEQVQEQSLATGNGSKELNFNHPVKELIWSQKAAKVGAEQGSTLKPISSGTGTFKLTLNGHDRFAARDWRYFSRTQVWQHHSGPGGLLSGDAGGGKLDDSIGVYSFALKPEEHQPSGTCNFSRIDNAQFVASGASNADAIFAVNYNVLRIMSGMGGLAYSN